MFKNLLLLLMIFIFPLVAAESGQQKGYRCASKEACLNDPNCLCWCSQICNWRKKTPEDHPVFIEDDPHGKYCYCKQWDFDYYTANCIEGKNIKQQPGAK